MSPLTPKQKAVYDYISNFTHSRGYPPSQQEIASAFGWRSLGTVQNYLVRLVREGVLEKNWNAKRGLKLIEPVSHAVELPLVGLVFIGILLTQLFEGFTTQ